MPPRTSARSSAKASSPPKQSSRSPIATRTRRTRSQSIELGNSPQAKRKTRRNARASSIESAKSNSSITSGRAGRTRKATRAAAAARDLSIVQEDSEYEDAEAELDPSTIEVQDEEEDEDEIEELEPGSQNRVDNQSERDKNEGTPERDTQQDSLRSPGGMSQMSGTTAITSHSVRLSRELDPLISELIGDLYSSAHRILDLLAPRNATQTIVDDTIRELKISGTRRAKLLRHDEETFRITRENYGTNEYITTESINRKLLSSPDPQEPFRPDAIIHAANLATMIKHLLVTERQSLSMHTFLTLLDTHFPAPFLKFDTELPGGSALRSETFIMALEIRTMFAIADLMVQKDEANFDPDDHLAAYFFEPFETRDSQVSDLDNALASGEVKDILRGGPPNSDEEIELILQRVGIIRSTFRYSDDAIAAGDLVDFEQLDDFFPWTLFLTEIVRWTRLRLTEIDSTIEQQGGSDAIRGTLLEAHKQLETQEDLDEQDEPRDADPSQNSLAASIAPDRSLYNPAALRLMMQMKREGSTVASSIPNASARPNLPGQRQDEATPQLQPSAINDAANDDWEPHMGDEDDDVPVQQGGRSTIEYLKHWDRSSQHKNKENRAPSLLDRQPNAHKVTWNDESEEVQTRPSKKRRRQVEEEEEEVEGEDSQDEGFEEDQRKPDPIRRAAAPPASTRTTIPSPRSPKRLRVDGTPGTSVVEDRPEQQVSRLERQLNNMQDDEPPSATAQEIRAFAREAGARVRIMNNEPQRRIPWSEKDEQLLLERIGTYGCKWAVIAKLPGWDYERPNFQVQCKDKARNLKVAYLKAGVSLPLNFDQIALGKKEIAAIQAVDPDFEYP